MAFQFQCPQGHLLEGDSSQAGQQCQCPECGTLFIIPEPITTPPEPITTPPEPITTPLEPEPALPGPPEFAGIAQGGSGGAFDPLGQSPGGGVRVLHIPCPNGHELETPPDMLNQDVMCPHCGVQFTLRERDSLESKRKRRESQERREHEAGQKWFTWAIAVAIVVAIGLIAMIAVSASR